MKYLIFGLAVTYILGYLNFLDFFKLVNEDPDSPIGWRVYLTCLLWPIFFGAIVTYIVIDKFKK